MAFAAEYTSEGRKRSCQYAVSPRKSSYSLICVYRFQFPLGQWLGVLSKHHTVTALDHLYKYTIIGQFFLAPCISFWGGVVRAFLNVIQPDSLEEHRPQLPILFRQL